MPILRKDFIVDEVQVSESRLWGADAILLIARILSKQQLQELLRAVQEMGMAALTEVHDQAGIQAVLVGSSIMKSHDIKGKAKEFVRAGRR